MYIEIPFYFSCLLVPADPCVPLAFVTRGVLCRTILGQVLCVCVGEWVSLYGRPDSSLGLGVLHLELYLHAPNLPMHLLRLKSLVLSLKCHAAYSSRALPLADGTRAWCRKGVAGREVDSPRDPAESIGLLTVNSLPPSSVNFGV